jgi:hypothetical protein
MEGEQPKYRYQYGLSITTATKSFPCSYEEATYFSEGYALAVPQTSIATR